MAATALTLLCLFRPVVSLYDSGIGDAGAVAIAAALEHNKTITCLEWVPRCVLIVRLRVCLVFLFVCPHVAPLRPTPAAAFVYFPPSAITRRRAFSPHMPSHTHRKHLASVTTPSRTWVSLPLRGPLRTTLALQCSSGSLPPWL